MRPRTRWIRDARRILAVGFSILVIAGMAYEQVGRVRERRRLVHIGTSYDVGGRTLNLHCVGSGGPTVILDAGANDPGYAWAVIQAHVAPFARVCWWDRAGFGWSAPGPYPMTLTVIAKDLHDLLHVANIPGPYVLVGYSFGGFVVRVYHGIYPAEVRGMVLVDAAHEDAGARIPAWGRALMPPIPVPLRYPVYLAAETLAASGVVRLLRHPRPFSAPGWTPEQAHVLMDVRSRSDVVAADASIGLFNDENERQVRASGGLRDTPLLVLTAGLPLSVPPQFATSAAAYQEVWKHELQPQLARLSSRGRQVIVAEAGHGMAFEMPEVVVGAIRDVVRQSLDFSTSAAKESGLPLAR